MFLKSKKEKLELYLEELGTKKISHIKGKSFFDHLCRIGNLLEQWGLPEEVVFAGMSHSLYSTEIFKTALLTLDRRNDLKNEIGDYAEKIVFTFCSIKRDSLKKNTDGSFSFLSHLTGEEIVLSEPDIKDLLHILLANDIDHLTEFNVQQMSQFFTARYLPWKDLLCQSAHDFILCISAHPSRIVARSQDFIRFIGHAGVQLRVENTSVVIDPWLYPSSREKPRLQGFDPTSFTIDYLIPEPRNVIEDLKSDIILLSHFHTHHAPLQEIAELAAMKPVQIVCPPLNPQKLEVIKEALGEKVFNTITFHFIEKDTELHIGSVTISCLYQLRRGHLGFLVRTQKVSLFHLSDPVASFNQSIAFDPVWEKFSDLKPDFAFISCAGHATRSVSRSGERIIDENQTFTPTQAAKFAIKLGAHAAGAVGIYNHSVWTDRIEFSRSPSEAENEFFWALSFLAPSIRTLTLRPGEMVYLDK